MSPVQAISDAMAYLDEILAHYPAPRPENFWRNTINEVEETIDEKERLVGGHSDLKSKQIQYRDMMLAFCNPEETESLWDRGLLHEIRYEEFCQVLKDHDEPFPYKILSEAARFLRDLMVWPDRGDLALYADKLYLLAKTSQHPVASAIMKHVNRAIPAYIKSLTNAYSDTKNSVTVASSATMEHLSEAKSVSKMPVSKANYDTKKYPYRAANTKNLIYGIHGGILRLRRVTE